MELRLFSSLNKTSPERFFVNNPLVRRSLAEKKKCSRETVNVVFRGG